MGNRSSTDFDQAHWLAEVLDERYRYDHTTRKWHRWDPVSGIWAFDQTADLPAEIDTLVDDVIRAITDRAGEHFIKDEDERAAAVKSFAKLKMVNDQHRALEALSALPAYKTDGADWDQDPYLLGCANGVVDLRVNALIKPNTKALVTKSTGHVFEPMERWSWADAERRAPVLMQSLVEWTSGDRDLAMFFLMWFGYSLLGLNTEQRFLILTGVGRNGKGALVTAMRHVFGEYSADVHENLYMRSRFGGARSEGARPDLMALKGKRMAAMSEPEGGAFNEEMIKAHTGGDPITARSLYSNNVISWEPTHSITILTNHPPKVDDVGPSMAARVMVADFREQFLGEREDKTLYERLKAEAPGQLSILVFCAAMYLERGLPMPDRVVKASREYIESSDPIGRAIEDVFVIEKGARGAAKLMYEQYLEWFNQNNEEGDPLSGTAFGLALKRRGLDKKKTMTGWQYIGIRPKSAVEIATDSTEGDN